MKGENHAFLGGVATFTILTATGNSVVTSGILSFSLAVTVGVIGAMLPDIDLPNSMIRRVLGLHTRQIGHDLKRWRSKNPLVNLLNLALYFLSSALDGLAKRLPHRGPTHWLIVAVGLTLCVNSLGKWLGWPPIIWQAFAIGYLSHLLADGCTKAGVKLFGPFYPRPIGLPLPFLRVRTGSWQEGIALFLLVLPFVAWLAYTQLAI